MIRSSESDNILKKQLLTSWMDLDTVKNEEYAKGWFKWIDKGNYDINFNCLLDSQNIAEIIGERKQVGKKTYALDLMSYGAYLRRFQLDKSLAVALTDPRTEALRSSDMARGLGLKVGNLMHSQPWREIQRWLKENQAEGFNFIFCRPLEGLRYIPNNHNLHYLLAQRMYSLLSCDQGVLLTQVPIGIWGVIPEWTRVVNQQPDIFSVYADPVIPGLELGWRALKIERGPKSPQRLPVLEQSFWLHGQ